MILWSLGWLLTSGARPAWAQVPAKQGQVAPDACVADARCKQLADRGLTQYQAQQYQAALASFHEAYALQPVPYLLFNIGRIHQKAGRTNQALAAYRPFLQQSRAADEDRQREKARVYVEQVERESAAKVVPTAIPVIPPPPPPPEKKPIYKKGWFWMAIGGGVVAITAIGLGVGLSERQRGVPPDINTYEPSF